MVVKLSRFIFQKFTSSNSFERTEKGFTMIELLIVVTIFTIVVGISVNIFTSVFDAQRQARQLQHILDNARYALERIAKTARVSCVLNTSNSSTSSLKLHHFRREAEITYKVEGGNLVEKEKGGVEADLVGENVDIERLNFNLQGVGLGDNRQPRISVFLGLRPELPKYEDEIIDIQTTVSPRFLEKYYATSSVCIP